VRRARARRPSGVGSRQNASLVLLQLTSIRRATALRQHERAGVLETPSPQSRTELLLSRPDADDEWGEWTADELGAEEASEIEVATLAADAVADAASDPRWQREQALLDQMQSIAEGSRRLPDAKLRYLLGWIRDNCCPRLPPYGKSAAEPKAKWNDRRVLISTENREGTKALPQDDPGAGDRRHRSGG